MDRYAYREYSNDYPRLFEIERDRIRRALEIPAQIEHIGSTAVVGSGGKGILDVGIGVAPQDRSSDREQLSIAGYEYRAKASTASRDFFQDYLRHHGMHMQAYYDTKARSERGGWRRTFCPVQSSPASVS